ncbi:MAG: glycosyltransferase [Terracidiphilus sp.]|jgi:glycosyltransferase involved in cell wall biosynthesis
MRIALLASLLGVEATGQSAAVASTAARLTAAGADVSIIGTDCGVRGKPVSKYVEIPASVHVHIFPSIGKLNRRLFRSPALTKWLKEHIQEFDVLDVQGVWSFVGKEASEVFAAANKPYVLTPHGMMTRYDWQKSMMYRKLFFAFGFGKVWREADAVRFLSTGERDTSYYRPIGRSAIVPNSIDIQAAPTPGIRHDARARLGIDEKTQMLLFIGRLAHQKGIKETLATFEIVAPQLPNLSLYLVGPSDGEYGREVLAMAAASAFRSRIVIAGSVFGDKKYDYLRAADAFITLSHNEGQSVAHLEALAEGLPMILTKNSNMDFLTEYGAGILVTHQPEEAAKAIVRIMSDPETLAHAGRGARRLVEEKYVPQVVIPQLLTLYNEVSGAKTSRVV